VSGVVLDAVDALDDRVPPERDDSRPAGNFVAIQPDDRSVYVLLAHLRRGSIVVSRGERVVGGQAIGRVGNSGRTFEPHLHVHAAELGGQHYLSGSRGVPITFGGRVLVRNRVVA
jgi:hypothetical protein